MENVTKYKGLSIKIVQDETASSPRENDNIGTMVCWHNRYDLSDGKNPFETPQDALQHFKEAGSIYLPIFMYDHSGLAFSTVRTYPFDDQWDAGQVGYIFCELDKARKEYGNLPAAELEKKVKDYMDGEIKTYNQFHAGDIWGYIIKDDKGEDVDSCWGFYGADYCLTEAKNAADAEIAHRLKAKAKKTKAYIKHHVPLNSRLEIA